MCLIFVVIIVYIVIMYAAFAFLLVHIFIIHFIFVVCNCMLYTWLYKDDYCIVMLTPYYLVNTTVLIFVQVILPYNYPHSLSSHEKAYFFLLFFIFIDIFIFYFLVYTLLSLRVLFLLYRL
jgi:hypothetical protein